MACAIPARQLVITCKFYTIGSGRHLPPLQFKGNGALLHLAEVLAVMEGWRSSNAQLLPPPAGNELEASGGMQALATTG